MVVLNGLLKQAVLLLRVRNHRSLSIHEQTSVLASWISPARILYLPIESKAGLTMIFLFDKLANDFRLAAHHAQDDDVAIGT